MVNVQLDDAVAAALSAKAAAEGLMVRAYLQTVLLTAKRPPGPRLSLEELERLLDEEATIGPSPSDYSSRADLYSDHD
ncbi:MAG TPA: hypothetical protein VGY55_07880 [Pirellulales bacterium]|jgi:hypothetical protein|nr:hypothetical protein [Pirellulales bacterium]